MLHCLSLSLSLSLGSSSRRKTEAIYCMLVLLYLPSLSFAFVSSVPPCGPTASASAPHIHRISSLPYSAPISSAATAALVSKSTAQDNDAANEQPLKRKKSRKRSNAVKWIACSSTTEVNRAIESYIRDGDAVAELGSQLRASSTTLCEAIGPTGRAVLVDVERKFPNAPKGNGNKAVRDVGGKDRTSAMRREGDGKKFYSDRATFIETKGFENWRDALFFRERSPLGLGRPRYDALVVDMSTVAGNDLELTCISLVREFVALNDGYNGFEEEGGGRFCRLVIVKSGSLHNLARRLHHAQHIVSGAQQLPEGRGVDGGCASIVAAVGVKQYRETINFAVRKGDVCVEVGCHLGTSTALIDEAAKNEKGETDNNAAVRLGGCLGVDVGASIVASAKKKYPHLRFEVGNGFKTGALARMKEKHFCIFKSNGNNSSRSSVCSSATYDVVYVDIGGLSGSEGLLEAVSLLTNLDHALEPRCIVIKSLCVRRLASCLVPFSEVWQKKILCK